ncbi:MAG: hypothetical protein QW279_10680 [Candidatus Jordarchaeaceae archaeon]
MPVDLLDQIRGNILERVAFYLYKNGGDYLDSIINKMSGLKDGEEYLERNVIGILKAADFISDDGKILLKDMRILNRCLEIENFGLYFRIELLSKINVSKEPNIGYFSDFLRNLLDNSFIDNTKIEEFLRESRRSRGIPISAGEELGGKTEYCIAFLKYFELIQPIGKDYKIYIPVKLLNTIIAIALDDIKKTSIKLYSELFEHIDKNYIPILDRKQNRLLQTVYNTMNKEDFITSFKFAHVPDGGREISLGNKKFNAILTR